VYVLALDMYLIYKVPVISILVATNVMILTNTIKNVAGSALILYSRIKPSNQDKASIPIHDV
jgi:hypothetical protein